MTTYSLDRFSVLLVEDNVYIRNLFENMFRQLGVGSVASAPNGAEAVEMVTGVEKYAGAPLTNVDVVVSDLVMSPLNGLLLLRWMRTAKESPNRFVPFVLVSGAADGEYVNAARDLGVTEFLAKPFSVQSVYKRLMQVIDHPRQFVMTKKFFGPDRRRRQHEFAGTDRRVMTEEDITVVYSAQKVAKPKGDADVWYFRLPNRLRELAGGLGTSGPGQLPLELLEKAEEELDRAAVGFADWALEYLAELSKLCDDALVIEAGRRRHFDRINLLAHELRGQGGTFGYPLVTLVAKMLFDATGANCAVDDNSVEIVKAHIDAMRVVLRDKIAGDGGAVGKELMISLESAIDKITAVA